MKRALLHIGIDPATEYIGLCIIDQDGNALPPVTLDDTILYGYRTFHTSGKNAFIRLDKLKEAIARYLREEVSGYFLERTKAGDHVAWEVASITVERPAMATYLANRSNRHDTQLVLGMSVYMCYEVARDYIAEYCSNGEILFFESDPRESSVSVGVGNRATKKQRNIRCAQLNGGEYVIEAERGGGGYVVGGNMHGANSDALDAYAAACQGRKLYIEGKLLNIAKQQQREQKKNVRKSVKPRG